MTAHRDLKKRIRNRQRKTGESYTTARAHVLREREKLLERGSDTAADVQPEQAEAVVLKTNQRSARVQIRGESGQVTFRSADISEVVPGQTVTLQIHKRWSWREDAYASGEIEDSRIDIPSLGLEPLPLEGGELDDVAAYSTPYGPPDPYAPLWRALTKFPRASFELDGVAWGAFPGREVEDNPTCEAAELAGAGDEEKARELLMEALCTDLRCIDAHAQLGNLAFDLSPSHALLHYEVGIAIAELSLPPGFDGLLVWNRLHNRPFLRCLYGRGRALWRLGRLADAQRTFERILSLNPSDNQGVRFCWTAVREGQSWAQFDDKAAPNA